MNPRLVAAALALAAALSVGAVHAHDTWFEPQAAARGSEVNLALGTGNRFPVFEQGVDVKFFRHSGCRSGAGPTQPLELLRYGDKATLLRSLVPDASTLTCWLQLEPFEFELPADKIEVYFKEIRPSAAVLAAWAGMKARGLPFIETYTKSARIDGAHAVPTPTGTAMDVLRGGAEPKVGAEVVLQVLREGRPLADFNVELINERSPIGVWQRTDRDGRLRVKLPLPGRWLLRGTDLRVSPGDATKWESQFITYAFMIER
jgi:hypothetical protein